jgi:microsomal dipeptidase-like Zn-dependent dipeptidase
VWLRLSTGRIVCVDALLRSSGIVHETNGRVAHAREDIFEDMQERHDALTAEGLTVLHNSPRRLSRHGAAVVAELERCHVRLDGRGLPLGITVLARAA